MSDQEIEKYLFAYIISRKKEESSKIALAIYGIALASVLCPLVFFLIQALTQDDIGWWGLAGFSMSLLFLFTVYPLWIKRFYFLGITDRGEVIMRSISNFIPRSSRFDLEQIRYIRSPDPALSMALVFLDSDRRQLGVFNPHQIHQKDFDQFLKMIRQHNPSIKFENW